MTTNHSFYRLQGVVQHYAWGGLKFIPQLLGFANPERRPFAEYWLGAHPHAPSLAMVDGQNVALNALIHADPNYFLGERVWQQFSRLPFLLKVLDARDMLSIQVHPSKTQAEAGFARENRAGILPDAADRTYKDDNHKPEVHVALTDFWMLHGFRPLSEIKALLDSHPEWAPLRAWSNDGIESLYRRVMTLPPEQVDMILQPLLDRLRRESHLDKDSPHYWALRAADAFPRSDGHIDRGIFSIYLLNLIHLHSGQGTFQDAGVPHAYLEGVNVELMANSDNVLRGGLTPKVINVDELLKTVRYQGEEPQILTGISASDYERIYPTVARDFELSVIDLPEGKTMTLTTAGSPSILLLLDGRVQLSHAVESIIISRGHAVFIVADRDITIHAQQQTIIFRAHVPIP